MGQYCNSNINIDPEFAYFDPNNVHIKYSSPCKDAGNPSLNYAAQVDMDQRERVYGSTVDMGAYEVDCEDTANTFDLNSDGRVNLYEFSKFSAAWLGHDPNDPEWLADPNLADPELSEGWYESKHIWNLEATGDSQYQIDLADLIVFVEDIPWLWRACWLTEEYLEMMSGGEQMMSMPSGGGESMMMAMPEVVISAQAEIQLEETPVGEEKTIEEQILDLESAIEFLEEIWLEEPDIQQEIDAEDWQEFMDSIYQNLLDLETEVIQNQ